MFSTVQDTIAIDTAALSAWRGNPEFDYERELVKTDFSLLRWIKESIIDFINGIFDSQFYHDYGLGIWIFFGALAVIALAVFIVYKRPGLFGFAEKVPSADYTVTEDSIYGVDFAAAIASAVERKDWREAVRMVYLQTLKALSDGEHIDWRPYKTPSQYAKEFPQTDFRTLSNHFQRVRYGNFEADEPLVEEMRRLQKAIADAVANMRGGGV